jgi:transcriptional regulator GlxA family with amidase domain
MTFAVGIYMFDGVEVLDFAGPFEVLWTAARLAARQRPDQPAMLLSRPPAPPTLIADRARTVQARGGLEVVCGASIAEHPPLDVLIVPGGVVDAELARPEVVAWIARTAPATRITASVCTGAFLLAKAGLLDGRRATTHWEDVDELRRQFPRLTVEAGPAWIDEDRIVTSAGISAGIDMSLHLVSRLAGEPLARATARQMDYRWRDA